MAWEPSMQNACKVEDAKLDPFIAHLCGMEKRIRVFPLYGDVEENKGFFVTKNHIFIPYQLPKIEHDIAHLVELNNTKRWTMVDWGMPRFTKDAIRSGPFFAALCREARTRAIQLHLQPELFGDENSTVFNLLNNSYWMSVAQKLLPYGRFKSLKDVDSWIGHLRERTYQAWSRDRIAHEWKIRLEHIQNWMETA